MIPWYRTGCLRDSPAVADATIREELGDSPGGYANNAGSVERNSQEDIDHVVQCDQ